jgi:apoptosis-inducing factor 3
MASKDKKEQEKPDFSKGIAADSVQERKPLAGKVGEDEAVLVRQGDEFFAIGATCTHYSGPLAEGLVVGETLRCPWHHACFSLRSGEALRAPALDPVSCWRVERVGDKIFVREKLEAPRRAGDAAAVRAHPKSVVIVGGGVAGLAAAEMLRREGYEGKLTMLSADDSAPYDRPNLSKDYLSGEAQEEWMPLRSPDFYKEQQIELVLQARVASLDVAQKRVKLEKGHEYEFDALLLATGAEPAKLDLPGADESQVHYLRTFSDSKALAAKAKDATQVVMVGASFIVMEAAAALTKLDVKVHVVAPEKVPFEKTLGEKVGSALQKEHEKHGVAFHLADSVKSVEGNKVNLASGEAVDADFIVVGAGVKPALELAQQAGLSIENGVLVNEYLETSAPGIFAAGDIARWPDARSGQQIRVEHFVVAERHGQIAAKNILGMRKRCDVVPFFWTQQYDVSVRYSGHAEKWDSVEIEGNAEKQDCAVTYKLGGRELAVATIGRDFRCLQAEAEMESGARSKAAS